MRDSRPWWRPGPGTGVHQGSPTGQAHRADPWSIAITATTDEALFSPGLGPRRSDWQSSDFPRSSSGFGGATLQRRTRQTYRDACLVAAIDHGPLSPSALVTRTIASTRATPMSGLAGGILSSANFTAR